MIGIFIYYHSYLGVSSTQEILVMRINKKNVGIDMKGSGIEDNNFLLVYNCIFFLALDGI